VQETVVPALLKARANRVAVERADTQPKTQDQVSRNPKWAPRGIVHAPRFESQASIAELKPKTSVIVRFAGSPSGRWCDPKVSSVALWDSKTASARPISPSLWSNLPGRKHGVAAALQHEWGGWPLCIPSYETAVEWRVESYVYSGPWREVKNEVVTKFLKASYRRQVECRVISLIRDGGKLRLLVHSDDYDEFLRIHWPYYKTLEGILTRGEYYRPEVTSGLRSSPCVFAEAVVSSVRFQGWITKTYGERFQEPIYWPDFKLMLGGIIKREGESIRRVESQRPRT
jgi:hypothetical protein